MPTNTASLVYGQQGNRWLPSDGRSALDARLAGVELTDGPHEVKGLHVVEWIVTSAGMFAIVELHEHQADELSIELEPFGTSIVQLRNRLLWKGQP